MQATSVFASGKPFQPGLLFAGKAMILLRDKHSSLFWHFVIDEEKCLITQTPGHLLTGLHSKSTLLALPANNYIGISHKILNYFFSDVYFI